jgi:hypothetical protein
MNTDKCKTTNEECKTKEGGYKTKRERGLPSMVPVSFPVCGFALESFVF